MLNNHELGIFSTYKCTIDTVFQRSKMFKGDRKKNYKTKGNIPPQLALFIETYLLSSLWKRVHNAADN